LKHKIKLKLAGLAGGKMLGSRLFKAPVCDRWIYYNDYKNRFASDLDGQKIKPELSFNQRDRIIRTLDPENMNVFGHVYERILDLKYYINKKKNRKPIDLKIKIRDPARWNKRWRFMAAWGNDCHEKPFSKTATGKDGMNFRNDGRVKIHSILACSCFTKRFFVTVISPCGHTPPSFIPSRWISDFYF
jgi:hypothetical protein